MKVCDQMIATKLTFKETFMQFDQVLHKFVGKSLCDSGIRLTKTNAILDMTNALLNHSQLTLTSIGRHLPGDADIKHKIKRVDRWLGNKSLYNQSQTIYKSVFQKLLAKRKKLEILVDWSGCCNWEESCLRASLAYNGRSIIIYQEVHTSKEQQKESVHKQFLKNLDNIIPKNCEVIVITDRGFGYSWFNTVKELGWDFIGRVAGFVHYKLIDGDSWDPINSLYVSSSNKTKYIGKVFLGKSHREKMEVSLYSYKEPSKNRKPCRTRNKPMYKHLNKQYSAMNTAPWVLATSLEEGEEYYKKIVKRYALRMQIEQNFRDDKNERWGFAMQFSRTKTPQRISILLMLVTIASFVLMMIGTASESLNLHRKFQANTVRNRRVLSLVTLAKQVMMHMGEQLRIENLIDGMNQMATGASYEFNS